jgi:hypothetical protein
LSGAIKRNLAEFPAEEPVAHVPNKSDARSRARLRVVAARTAQVRFVDAMIALSEVGGSNRADMVSHLSAALSEAARAIQGAGNVDHVCQPAVDDDDFMKCARALLKLVLDGGDEFAPEVARVVAESRHIRAFQQRWFAIYRSWVSPTPKVSSPIEMEAGGTEASCRTPSIGKEAIADPGTIKGDEDPLSKNQWVVLAILYDHAKHLLTVERICAQLRAGGHSLCETTVKKFLRHFGEQGLTERPGNGHNGAQLTPKGRALVERRAGALKLPPV